MLINVRGSLRTRLTVWYAALLAALLIVYAVVVLAFQYATLTRQLYHDEVQDVITVEGLLYFDAAGTLNLSQSYFSRPQSHLLIDRLMEVRALDNTVLYRSPTLHGMELGGHLAHGEGDINFNERIVRLEDGSHAFVVSHIHTLQGRTMIIRVGYSLEPLTSRMGQFVLILLAAIPVALAIASIAGNSIAKRALRPLDQMASRAQAITASNLSDRLDVHNEDELGQMAEAFNELLARLESAFLQLQRFTADAAHELRTPLAAIRTISEVALEKGDSLETYKDALGNVLEEAHELEQTVASLLLLAKAESTNKGEGYTSFYFAELFQEIVSLLDVIAEDRELTIVSRRETLGRVMVPYDRSLIRVALINVMHNALKFSPRNGTIQVSFAHRSRPMRLEVKIQDEGPGIDRTELNSVFERFYTSSSPETAKLGGTGLGLSMAKLIIERSGGEIHFEQQSSKGAVCVFTIPCELV